MPSRIIRNVPTVTRATATAREAWNLLFELSLANQARLIASLEEVDLTFPQAHALRLLDPDRPLSMSEIAERLVCDASNVTGISDRLEARGLLERGPSPNDRRIKVLTLTDEGRALHQQLWRRLMQHSPVARGLDDHEQRTLRELLHKLVDDPQD